MPVSTPSLSRRAAAGSSDGWQCRGDAVLALAGLRGDPAVAGVPAKPVGSSFTSMQPPVSAGACPPAVYPGGLMKEQCAGPCPTRVLANASSHWMATVTISASIPPCESNGSALRMIFALIAKLGGSHRVRTQACKPCGRRQETEVGNQPPQFHRTFCGGRRGASELMVHWRVA